MADGETLVTETSTAADYSAAGYVSTGYGDFVSNAASGHTQYAADASGGAVDAAYATMPGVDGSAYAVDGRSLVQVASHGEVNKTGENVAAGENAAGYNSSVNGTVGNGAEGAMAVENGTTNVVSSGAAAEQQYAEGSVPSMSGEEDRLWNIVRANSLDFDAWTRLIEETEKVAGDNILKIRKVYDAFLAEFPLCYGYWKKYADHEARLGSMEKVVEVYERAVLGVTYSVDIWLHYCTFAIHTYGDPETVRSLFERGLAYVGTDYLSYLLWDKYIEYEETQAAWSRVATIYTRILEIPNKQLDDYLNRFKGLAASQPLVELRTAEEAAAATATVTSTAPASEDRDQSNEGGASPVDAEHSSEPISAGVTESEEMEKYVSVREDIYKRTKEFDSKICDFENAIRRPYFHVKPLNIIELENWHNYLDFIEGEGDFSKVVKLYERCLIACANYPEYWIRYVLSMEASGSMDLATNALTRATQVFVKRQPEIHLFAARFREQNGDIPGARAAYQLLHTEIAPGLCEAVIKHANMEHRLGNQQDAFSLYEQAIAIEKGKEQSQALPMFYAQYSRFVYLVSGNAEKAREILDDALQNVQLSKPLLEALIHLESFQTPPKRIDYLDSLVEKFIVPNSESSVLSTAAEKEELSSIFLEFLDLFGDAQIIKKAADRHTKLFFTHKSKSDLKKRPAEDYLTSDKAKLANTVSPAQAMIGAQPNAQNQWAAGYGVQPQAWTAATQPWTPAAYSQPATYGAYGAYGTGYTATQAPAPVTQTAAYATYPPTYPAQAAYPQQSYAQPTATAAAAPAQQPAAVPQPYYGTTTYY